MAAIKESIKKWLIGVLIRVLFETIGKFGKEVAEIIAEADAKGLAGREAWEYVTKRAKEQWPDIGEWFLNLVIEVTVGKKEAQARKLLKKLKFPSKFKF